MFETHKLNEKGFEEMKAFKTEMSIAVSKCINMMGPQEVRTNTGYKDIKEIELFKQKIEEAVFFGAKAIAQKSGNHTEVVDYPEMPKQKKQPVQEF